ncbi:hypothetical protein EDB84DRAFT_1438573 [Lactarius hengduanensis]|nr:hypothetical protein EDB84DRAFT_1438573 [Lactarius hengduanensis]
MVIVQTIFSWAFLIIIAFRFIHNSVVTRLSEWYGSLYGAILPYPLNTSASPWAGYPSPRFVSTFGLKVENGTKYGDRALPLWDSLVPAWFLGHRGTGGPRLRRLRRGHKALILYAVLRRRHAMDLAWFFFKGVNVVGTGAAAVVVACLVRPFVDNMTESEIHFVMTSGRARGSVAKSAVFGLIVDGQTLCNVLTLLSLAGHPPSSNKTQTQPKQGRRLTRHSPSFKEPESSVHDTISLALIHPIMGLVSRKDATYWALNSTVSWRHPRWDVLNGKHLSAATLVCLRCSVHGSLNYFSGSSRSLPLPPFHSSTTVLGFEFDGHHIKHTLGTWE